MLAKNTYVWLDQLSKQYKRDIRTPGPDPRRGAGHPGPARLHRPVADRPVGAQQGLAAHQADDGQAGRGGFGLLALRLPDRRRPGRLRAPTRTCATGPGSGASAWPATWCPTTWASTASGSSSTPTGSCSCPTAPSRPTPSTARTCPRCRVWASTWRTITTAAPTQPWFSSAATSTRGEVRYIYHGNDGTSMPWNDTAQLNYLLPEVREAVIQTILHVARMFPIIRFDAAMTLAKRHYQRLWFPEPGSGGDIASRAEYGLTKDQFNAVFPEEFWREVVDRVAAEVPDTLLLAEAFWLMEGYFVRTLGMHRVYNSAFMNMLKMEDNAKYRLVIKNTVEFDPEILKRYVNFMNNPDEDTAVAQFGKEDKYFGVATLMATMPGLPMFGHGQVEGFTEKYGMEFRRPMWDETPDPWLVAPPRARDLPAAAQALRLRRGGQLPPLRLLQPRRLGQRGCLRLLQPGRRRARAGDLPQQVGRGARLDPHLGRLCGQGAGRRQAAGADQPGRRAGPAQRRQRLRHLPRRGLQPGVHPQLPATAQRRHVRRAGRVQVPRLPGLPRGAGQRMAPVRPPDGLPGRPRRAQHRGRAEGDLPAADPRCRSRSWSARPCSSA